MSTCLTARNMDNFKQYNNFNLKVDYTKIRTVLFPLLYSVLPYEGEKGSTEYSKGNKTVPGKVATTLTEDGHNQNTKTSATIF